MTLCNLLWADSCLVHSWVAFVFLKQLRSVGLGGERQGEPAAQMCLCCCPGFLVLLALVVLGCGGVGAQLQLVCGFLCCRPGIILNGYFDHIDLQLCYCSLLDVIRKSQIETSVMLWAWHKWEAVFTLDKLVVSQLVWLIMLWAWHKWMAVFTLIS